MYFFFSSRRRHTRYWRDWSSDVCSSDLVERGGITERVGVARPETVGYQRGITGIHVIPLRAARVGDAEDAIGRLGGHRSEERRVGKEWRGRCRQYSASTQ